MELQGTLTIARYVNSDDRRPIKIELVDDRSTLVVATIHIGLAELMTALTAGGAQACHFAMNAPGMQYVGRQQEYKHETIFLPYKPSGEYVSKYYARLQNLIKPFEIDGWIGRWRDLQNPNNRCMSITRPKGKKGDWYRVHFYRFVDVPPEPSESPQLQE